MDERLNELLSNEEFMNKLAATRGNNAILALLKENGVDMSETELAQCISQGKEVLREKGILLEDDELTAEGLDLISGGRFDFGAFLGGSFVTVASAAIGFGPGVAMGVAIVGASFLQ